MRTPLTLSPCAIICTCLFLLTWSNSYSQPNIYNSNPGKKDSIVFRYFCKNTYLVQWVGDVPTIIPSVTKPTQTIPLLQIHGNIQYSFLQRSYVDTPFAQHNSQQHTVQTSLSIVVKDRYPLNFNLSSNFNNSPYFRNFFNVGMQWDPRSYARNRKQELMNRISKVQYDRPDLKMVEASLRDKVTQYQELLQRLREPDIKQRIVEEREQQINQLNKRDMPNSDSALNKFASDNTYAQFIGGKEKELDSLRRRIVQLQDQADSIRQSIGKNIMRIQRKLFAVSSNRDLKKIATENGDVKGKQKGLDNFLADVKAIGIGRSMVNYTELTAYNISVTGLNIEYNPGIYAALTAGNMDYGFRDFLGRRRTQRPQQLLMGRLGFGDKDHTAVIFSAYTGKKYNYGSTFSDTLSNRINLSGYSVEAIWKKNANTSFSVELAKSTKPITGSLHNNNGIKDLVNFSDQANLGINVKAETVWEKTNTKLSGFYRKTGEAFQSFSLFSYNTDQTAWLAKLDQSLLKDHVSLIAMLRRNDFTNPFSEKTFKTSTTFTSFQATARFPKWPVVSAGYYPGTQLYIIDKERIREDAYYIINGSIVYPYSSGSLSMISSLIYNKYSSKGTDTGFIAYNGVNYMASQTFIIGRAELQAAYTWTDQELLRYATWELNGSYAFGIVRLGAGLKYNKISNGKAYIGSRYDAGLDFKKLGNLQVQYEKSYLPTVYRSLFPVEMGRVTWYKYF